MSEQYLPIKFWAEDDQPREKLLRKGIAALSTNELLAVILRFGKKGESAIDLSRRILADCNNDLNVLAKLSVAELMGKYDGIGIAKAAGIIVALELGRRRMPEIDSRITAIKSSADVYNYIAPLVKDLTHEEFWVIYLNRSNKILGSERLSSGGMSSTVIDVRMLFKKVLDVRASAIVVAHNHPGGALVPSEYDKAVTEKIIEAGNILDITLHDHLIIGGDFYYSFVDEDLMEELKCGGKPDRSEADTVRQSGRTKNKKPEKKRN